MPPALPGAPVFERRHVVRPASTPKTTGIGAVRFSAPTTKARETSSRERSDGEDEEGAEACVPSASRRTNDQRGRGSSGKSKGGERKAKPRSRSTRTGAVSARTRLAFSPERALGQKTTRKPSGTKVKAKGKGDVKSRASDGRLPGTRPARSESFKYLNERGELEDLDEGVSKRRLMANDAESLRESMKQKREDTNRRDALAKTSGKKGQQKSAQAKAALDTHKRNRNVPFEANVLYSPEKVVVSVTDTLNGPEAWYTNDQLIELCAPGALLDISAKSLTRETKAEISSALRHEVSGVKVPTFLRVKVLSHHLDTSGWTLTTVQVKAASTKSSAHDVEIVFNLTEEAANGYVRLYRHAGKNGRPSQKQRKLPTSSTDASGSYVPPSTPPRARTPSPKKRKTAEQDGSSERSARQQEDEMVDVETVPTRELVHEHDQDAPNVSQRNSLSRLPDLPRSAPPAQGRHSGQQKEHTPNVAIGEISGFLHTDVGLPSAPKRSPDYFDDKRHEQLSDFYNRVHEISNITTPTRLAAQSDQVYAPESFLPRSPALARGSEIPPPGVSTRPMEQVVTPTVYYVPISVPPQGVSGVSITETIVGSVRVRITQEPLDQPPRSDPVIRTTYQHVPQRTADIDASSDIHHERPLYETQALPRVMRAASQEDDDKQLAANLLMLKTSVTGKKRRTKLAPKHRSAPINNKRVK